MCWAACLRRSALALLLVLALAARAGAEPPSKREVERARRAYEAGAAAYKLGSFAEAAARFEEAYRIMRFPTMLFDVAQSYRRLGESEGRLEPLRKALEVYRAYLRDAPPGAEHRPLAERLIPGLERAIAAQTRRQRQELIDRAAGAEGLPVIDRLLAEGAAEDALVVAERVLGGPRNPRPVILGALGRRGAAAARLGRRELALDSFRRALSLDPGLALPEGAGPAAEQLLAEARRAVAGSRPLALLHVPPGAVPRGQPARVPVSLEADPAGLVAELALHYRPAGRGAYSTVRAPRTAREIAVPAAFLQNLRGGAAVEYYVAALDAREGELASAGSAAEPFVLQVAPAPAEAPAPPRAATAWYGRWWVWTIVGGVALGAAGGAYLLTRDAPYNPTPVEIPTR